MAVTRNSWVAEELTVPAGPASHSVSLGVSLKEAAE